MKILTVSIVVFLFSLLSYSCSDEAFQRFGFDSFFEINSEGLVIVHLGYNTESVYLEGNIALTKGELKMEFCNPIDEIVYERKIDTPGTIQIDEIVPVSSGVWKLKYKSLNGAGSIDLHASF